MGKQAEDLGERIAEQAAHLDAASHRLLTDLRVFDESGEWHKQGAQTCAHWLSWRVGWDLRTSKQHLRVATKLGGLPLIDDALRCGKVSYAKVRAMTRVATPENEATLLEYALHSTAAQLELICRKYRAVMRGTEERNEQDDRAKRFMWRRELENGMVRIELTVHPEEAEIIYEAFNKVALERSKQPDAPVDASVAGGAVDASGQGGATQPGEYGEDRADHASVATCSSQLDEVAIAKAAAKPLATPAEFLPLRERTTMFSRVDALITMAQEVLRGSRPRRSPTEVIVTVSSEVLYHPGEAADPIGSMGDGTCVSSETIRRLSCDCGVVHVHEDEMGNTMSVGRKTRSIPPAIHRALIKRDQTCRFPGCTNRVCVQGHHLKHWADGGETTLENLVTVCDFHHRFVHEYEFGVVLDDHQHPTFFDPHGRPIKEVPDAPLLDNLGWPAIREQNEDLEISSDTQYCRWDGMPVQYGDAIDWLVRADA